MKNFLRMAETHLAPVTQPSNSEMTPKPPQVINTYRTGARNLWSTRVSQYQTRDMCKFKWGYLPSHLDHTTEHDNMQMSDMLFGVDDNSDEENHVFNHDSESEDEII